MAGEPIENPSIGNSPIRPTIGTLRNRFPIPQHIQVADVQDVVLIKKGRAVQAARDVAGRQVVGGSMLIRPSWWLSQLGPQHHDQVTWDHNPILLAQQKARNMNETTIEVVLGYSVHMRS